MKWILDFLWCLPQVLLNQSNLTFSLQLQLFSAKEKEMKFGKITPQTEIHTHFIPVTATNVVP